MFPRLGEESLAARLLRCPAGRRLRLSREKKTLDIFLVGWKIGMFLPTFVWILVYYSSSTYVRTYSSASEDEA